MIEYIEIADGAIMAVEFESKEMYDEDTHSYYDWLNEIAYTGYADIYEIEENQIDSARIIKEA